MAAALPLLIIVIFFLQFVYLRTSRQLQFLDLEARSPLYSHFLETLDGIVTIRAFGWEEKYKESNIKHIDHSQRPYYLLYCIQRWLNLVLDLIVAALAVLVVSLALTLKHSTSPGLLGVSLNNVLGEQMLSTFFESTNDILKRSAQPYSRWLLAGPCSRRLLVQSLGFVALSVILQMRISLRNPWNLQATGHKMEKSSSITSMSVIS